MEKTVITYKAANLMELIGGSFAKCIAIAWFAADPINKKRIESAFPELFGKYIKMATIESQAITND